MEEKKISNSNNYKAKEFVDFMFDNNMLNKSFTRDDMNGLQDLLAYDFQCIEDSTKRSVDFLHKVSKATGVPIKS